MIVPFFPETNLEANLVDVTHYPNKHLLKNQSVSQSDFDNCSLHAMSEGAGLPSRQEMKRMGRGTQSETDAP